MKRGRGVGKVYEMGIGKYIMYNKGCFVMKNKDNSIIIIWMAAMSLNESIMYDLGIEEV